MPKNASFLPEDYVEKRAQRRTNFFNITLFLIVMGGIVGAFIVNDRQHGDVRALQASVNQQFADAAKRLEQLDELQGRKTEMLRKAEVSSVLVERVPRSLLLSELINNMPSTLSLVEFKLETKVVQNSRRAVTALDKAKAASRFAKTNGAGQPDIKPTEITINLTGVAPTDMEVSQFMSALSKNPLVQDLNLAYSLETKIQDQLMRRFRIDLVIEQDLDLTAVQPRKVERELKQNPMDQTAGSRLMAPVGGAGLKDTSGN